MINRFSISRDLDYADDAVLNDTFTLVERTFLSNADERNRQTKSEQMKLCIRLTRAEIEFYLKRIGRKKVRQNGNDDHLNPFGQNR